MRQSINNDDNIVLTRHRIPRRFQLNKIDMFNFKRSMILIGVFKKAFNDLNKSTAMCAYVDDLHFYYIFSLCDDAIYFIGKETDDDVVIKKIIKLDRVVKVSLNETLLSLSVRKPIKKNEIKEYVVNCNDRTITEQISTMIQSYITRQNVF